MNTPIARSSVWPLALLVLIAGIGMVRIWGAAWRLHPDEPWAVSLIYRSRGAGDIQYDALISQIARGIFGEASLYEDVGRGIMSFPLCSLAPHAIALRLFGAWGFVVADGLVFAAMFASLVYFLRVLRVGSPWRESLAVFLVCGGQNALHQALGTDFWHERLPRTFVTTVYLVLWLAVTMRLVRSRRTLSSRWTWILLGVLLSTLLQSFIYNAINAGLVTGVIALYALTRGRTRRGVGRIVLAQVLFGVALVLASGFFIAQRLGEHPDVPRRYGTFPIPRSNVLRYVNVPPLSLTSLILPLAFVAVAAIIVRFFDRRTDRLARLRCLAVLALADVAGVYSLPASVLLLGKTIAPYHFPGSAFHLFFYTYVACVVIAIDVIARRVAGLRGRRAGYLALLLSFAWAVTWVGKDIVRPREPVGAVRSDLTPWSSDHYREDFTALVKELSGPGYAGDKVIATLDPQVASWWLSFRPGFLFFPDAFMTNVPDSTLERRFILFSKVLNLDTPRFLELLNKRHVLLWLSCNKYQVSKGYTFAPLSDYPPEVKQIVNQTTIYVWGWMIPLSEQARLARAFETPLDFATLPPLDLLVLGKEGPEYVPSADHFTLTYENPTFRVLVHKGDE